MRVPRATYRLQLNRDFTLTDAGAVVNYLDALGVETVYASPLLVAPRSAAHGYHVTDPTRINPELGGEVGLAALHAELERHGMGLLLDIVPNHLAATTENPWWRTVLQHGPASVHAKTFDIDWEAAGGRVVLPVLGRDLDQALAAGELQVGIDEHGLQVRYHDHHFPLDPATYDAVLPATIHGGLREILARIPPRDVLDAHAVETRQALSGEVVQRLWAAHTHDHAARRAVVERLEQLNADPRSLRALLDRQAYRLTSWRTGVQEINYRRFFDISELVAVRVEDPDVFATTHDLLLRLVADRVVTGFRVDHVDGLRDPTGYLDRLQDAACRAAPDIPHHDAGCKAAPDIPHHDAAFYIVVEKILEGDEPLPPWPVAGTTGYEFLNALNEVLIDPRGLDHLGETYRAFTGLDATVADVVYVCKRAALETLFRGEVDRLTHRLVVLAADLGVELTEPQLRPVVVAVTAAFPVYRTYIGPDGAVSAHDRHRLDHAFAAARGRHSDLDAAALDFVERVLRAELRDAAAGRRAIEVVLRWQQLTGPAMAKGFEDTTFYVYNRLVSLNEVGVDVEGMEHPHGVEGFHTRTVARAMDWPHALNATSTHDTKRSEDVRARLHVLSEFPEEWARAVSRWSSWNASLRQVVAGQPAPDANDEWLLYQTLTGMWPLQNLDLPRLRDRAEGFLLKAAREAKVHTSWLDPDERYEAALAGFVGGVLDDARFVDDLTAFVERIALPGAVNSLAQLVLRLAAPGVADFYQGTELWDWSLVDPDNRRPVDYEQRRRRLARIRSRCPGSARVVATDGAPDAAQVADVPRSTRLVAELRDAWRDGGIKLLVTWRGLELRREQWPLFRDGDYTPLRGEGPLAGRVVSFARRHGDHHAVVVAPRLTARLVEPGQWPVGGLWAATRLRLPPGAPGRLRDVMTGREIATRSGKLDLADVLEELPVALLIGV